MRTLRGLPNAQALHTRQQFSHKERQLVDIIDQAECHTVQAGIAEFAEFSGDEIRIADNGEGADPAAEPATVMDGLAKRLGPALKTDPHQRVDAFVIRHLDGVILVIFLRLLLTRPADNVTTGIDPDILAEFIGRGPQRGDFFGEGRIVDDDHK